MLVKNNVTACNCEKCNDEFPLSFIDIHHVEAIAEGGKGDGKTITVCRKCHYSIHGKEYNPSKLLIEPDEWVVFAQDNLTYDKIAELYDVRRHVIERLWELDGNRVKWPTFKKMIKKGMSFDEIMKTQIRFR